MNVKCTVDTKELVKNLNRIYDNVGESMGEILNEMVANTRKIAESLTPVNSGEVLGSYSQEVASRKFHGSAWLFNQSQDALFVYYGTGIYATKPHIGSSQTFMNSGMTRWYVPVNDFPEHDKYNYPVKVMADGTELVQVHGQKPNKFMEKAFNATFDQNIDVATRIIQEKLK